MIKIIMAKAAEGREQAKIFVKINHPDHSHVLKLHQGSGGVWFPELEVNMDFCQDLDVNQVKANLVSRLRDIATILESDEAAVIPLIANTIA